MQENEDRHYTKLTTKVKRGTDTRDQDTTQVVTRHPDPKVAVQNHQEAIQQAQQFAKYARAVMQPEEYREE